MPLNVHSTPNFNEDLQELYHSYIDTLNAKDWTSLSSYLDPNVIHNDKRVGHAGYRDLIPAEIVFRIDGLVVDVVKRDVASRLYITVAGKPLREHCFYRWKVGEDGRTWVIQQVWSIVEEIKEGGEST